MMSKALLDPIKVYCNVADLYIPNIYEYRLQLESLLVPANRGWEF